MSKQVTVIAIVIGLAVGFGAGWFIGKSFTADKYEKKIEVAREKFPDVGTVRRTGEMRTLNGTVVAVEGNVVRISIAPSPDPFEEWPTEREVVVGEDTLVVRRVVKEPAIYQAEQAAFVRNPQGEYPQPYEDVSIELNELLPGTTLGIETNRDVKFEKRFEATVIRAL